MSGVPLQKLNQLRACFYSNSVVSQTLASTIGIREEFLSILYNSLQSVKTIYFFLLNPSSNSAQYTIQSILTLRISGSEILTVKLPAGAGNKRKFVKTSPRYLQHLSMYLPKHCTNCSALVRDSIISCYRYTSAFLWSLRDNLAHLKWN